MNLLFKLFVFTLLSLLIGKPIVPYDPVYTCDSNSPKTYDSEQSCKDNCDENCKESNSEESVLLLNVNNKGRNYTYYELDKSGLDYSDISGFSEKDSIRIKFYIREVVSGYKKAKQDFKIDLILNNKTKSLAYKNKDNSKHSLKNRPGWSVTEPGIWFVDILYSDIEKLSLKKSKPSSNIIIRSVVEKINRQKFISRTIETVNLEKKYKIDTRSQRSGKLLARNWYKLVNHSDELQLEVVGPTSIRIFSRIGNPNHDSKGNDYSLFIKEDGLDIGTFYFNTELSSISNLHDTGEKISKWRSCWINVPKGKHYYTIRKGAFPIKELQFQANINDDIYNTDNSIYIRVKRYDQE